MPRLAPVLGHLGPKGEHAWVANNSKRRGTPTIEELYTLGKFRRAGLQSANIDGNAQLCTATSATGLTANFGSDGPVASYAECGDVAYATLASQTDPATPSDSRRS